MKNAGMAGAVALVGIGLITIGLSNFANRADAEHLIQQQAAPTVVGTVLDVGMSSGRWGSRLIAIRSDGSVVELETQQQPRWKPFKYSP